MGRTILFHVLDRSLQAPFCTVPFSLQASSIESVPDDTLSELLDSPEHTHMVMFLLYNLCFQGWDFFWHNHWPFHERVSSMIEKITRDSELGQGVQNVHFLEMNEVKAFVQQWEKAT